MPEISRTVMAARIFRRPGEILQCYLRRSCPENLFVETRAGQKIYLTGDADDVVTLLVVMGRRDYGAIPKGGVIIDIGAHLGGFTLYAAANGAREIYSYEPDPLLYATLLRNVEENGLSSRVRPWQAAVVGQTSGQERFYQEGNASGHIDPAAGDGEAITVQATTLADIIWSNRIPYVDLLKLDCEGSEYGILRHTPEEIWSRIGRVRMEYHKGRLDEIKERLGRFGYKLTRERTTGVLWFEREDLVAANSMARACANTSNTVAQ